MRDKFNTLYLVGHGVRDEHRLVAAIFPILCLTFLELAIGLDSCSRQERSSQKAVPVAYPGFEGGKVVGRSRARARAQNF